MNFKVGDKVRFIEKYWYMRGFGKNDHFIIAKICTEYYRPRFYFSKYYSYDYGENLELVEPFIIQKEEDYYTWLAKR